MNNKGLSIFNLLLTLALMGAVIYLLISKPTIETPEIDNVETVKNTNDDIIEKPANSGAMIGQLKVVYVNTDSLWEQYEFVKNTLNGLEREQKRLQVTYESKMKKFEKDYTDYMQKGKANLLSLKQQQDYETSLEKQQNDIKMLEDEVTNKLIVKKQDLNQQINDTIQAFLNRYRIANEYDMILQHSYLNGILSATSDIDITEDVVLKLNKEYQTFKK